MKLRLLHSVRFFLLNCCVYIPMAVMHVVRLGWDSPEGALSSHVFSFLFLPYTLSLTILFHIIHFTGLNRNILTQLTRSVIYTLLPMGSLVLYEWASQFVRIRHGWADWLPIACLYLLPLLIAIADEQLRKRSRKEM